MNVAIVGYGVEGRASAVYFAARGHTVTICDKQANTEVPKGFQAQLGNDYLAGMGKFDVIVRSAGIHPRVILEKNPDVAAKITTATNEFVAQSPTRNVIGVTGTKGKGTTSTLIANILEAAGRKTWLGGNIGRSPLEFIDRLTENDWVVLELSSFQLYDLRRSPHIAVCLMVVPEHLNWHDGVEDYHAAKSHLFEYQKSDDVAIYYADNATSSRIASASQGRKVPFYRSPGAFINESLGLEIDAQPICSTDELKLLGKHNWQNVCAAVTAVWQADCHDIAAIRSVLTSFTGLPHRLEKVRTVHDITYYNDSFAATPDAAIAAAEAISGNKVMIIGGFDRMLPIDHLADMIAAHTDVKALLIGKGGRRLATVLEARHPEKTNWKLSTLNTMTSIVDEAMSLSTKGSSIVLSPGFASFDMFKNFEDRGNQYKKVVLGL